MRIFSYFFHALLGLFLLAIAVLALLGGTVLHLEMFPWSGHAGTYILLGAAIFGLFSLFLALKGSMRFLFFLWSLAVVVLLVKGFFLSGYRFEGPSGFRTAALLTVGALLALVGAWFQMTRKLARG